MQQGAEGTERFSFKHLLKPIDNVSLKPDADHLGAVTLQWLFALKLGALLSGLCCSATVCRM